MWLQRIDLATRPLRDIEEMRKQQDLLGDLLRLAEEARAHPPGPRHAEVGSNLELSPPNEVTTAIQEGMAKLLDEPRLAAVLGFDPWDVIDWPRLIRRAEVLAIDGLLPDEGADS